MGLDPSHPAGRALSKALSALAESCGAEHAAVVDEGFVLWAEGFGAGAEHRSHADAAARFHHLEIVPRISEMRHGVAIGMQNVAGPDYYVAQSFASLYVVVVWFDGPFEVPAARARVLEALPQIEAITLSLPPFDGPDATSGVAAKRYA